MEHTPPQSTGAPPINKEALVAKLREVPLETLRGILLNQVDLEIRLKHKELELTREELGKCEAQMLAVRKYLEVPSNVSLKQEPDDFTLRYFDILNRLLSASHTKLQQEELKPSEPPEPAHSYRTRLTTASLRPVSGSIKVAGCLYRRTDGVTVKLTCVDCGRCNFSTAQGFLNHLRIAHNQEYASQDAAAVRCGAVLPEEFQDDEGIASIRKLKARGLDPNTVLNINAFYGPRSHAPVSELMKKVVKTGVAQETYKEMVASARASVANAHLFEDEEEAEPRDEKLKGKGSGVPGDKARRSVCGKPFKGKPEGSGCPGQGITGAKHTSEGASTAKTEDGVRRQPEGASAPRLTILQSRTLALGPDWEKQSGPNAGVANTGGGIASGGPVHATTGLKYENRLRRRRSKAEEEERKRRRLR